MGVISQIQLLIRRRTRAAGTALVDGHGLEIAEQAIHESEQALVSARHELASVVMQRRRFEQQATQIRRLLERRDGDGREALAGGHATLARRVAADVAAQQAQLRQVEQSIARLDEQETLARDGIKQMIAMLEQSRAEFRTLRGLEAAAKANALSGAGRATADARLADLASVMQRVRDLQDEGHERARTMVELERDLSGGDLEDELLAAGVGGRQDAVDAILSTWRAPAAESGIGSG